MSIQTFFLPEQSSHFIPLSSPCLSWYIRFMNSILLFKSWKSKVDTVKSPEQSKFISWFLRQNRFDATSFKNTRWRVDKSGTEYPIYGMQKCKILVLTQPRIVSILRLESFVSHFQNVWYWKTKVPIFLPCNFDFVVLKYAPDFTL